MLRKYRNARLARIDAVRDKKSVLAKTTQTLIPFLATGDEQGRAARKAIRAKYPSISCPEELFQFYKAQPLHPDCDSYIVKDLKRTDPGN